MSQVLTPPIEVVEPPVGQPIPRSARLMQNLGINLWQWLFDGVIQSSLNRSQGIAQGQGKALRLRLDVRDPELISLPWEIMQSDAGKQAISLSQQLLFSRTTSDVDSLPALRSETSLNVLLVLGQDAAPVPTGGYENGQRDQIKAAEIGARGDGFIENFARASRHQSVCCTLFRGHAVAADFRGTDRSLRKRSL